MYGISIGQMRRLFRSRDEQAVRRIQDRLAADHPYWRADELRGVSEIIERAIMIGVPFSNLETETYLHTLAAGALALDQQEWLATTASVYHATALEDGLWRQYARYARPEIRAFLRGLVEGVPMFGQQPPADNPYAAISLEKLQSFRRGLEDLREQVTYRVARKRDPSEDDRGASAFVIDFCGWVDQIRQAGRDLWYVTG
jgi:hypothetical protein